MLDKIYEHNTLNGFRFVLIEFLLVAAGALLCGFLVAFKGNTLWAVVYFGIAANAAVICGTVIGQMRRGERSGSLAETYSREGREAVRRNHPNLDRHTFQIVAAILVPFLLAALTVREMVGKRE